MAKQKSGSTPKLGAILEKLFEEAPEYFVVLDTDLRITDAGATFRDATGLAKDRRASFLDTVEKFSLSRVRTALEGLRDTANEPRALEIKHRLSGGESVAVAYSWTAICDESGAVEAFVGVGRESHDAPEVEANEDVEKLREEMEAIKTKLDRRATEITRLRTELEHQATSDEMTGLGNRRYLMERLEFEAARAIRYDQPLTLILADVDRMTHVNEEFGHDSGNNVLRAVANVVKEQIRSSDMAGRYSGEEFLILCPHTDRANAQFLAERLRRRVEQLSFVSGDEEFGVTVSVGLVTVAGQNEFDVEAIVSAAEQALESAKTGGMNRVRILEVL